MIATNWTKQGVMMSNGSVISTNVEVDHLYTEDSIRISYMDEDTNTENIDYTYVGGDSGVRVFANMNGDVDSLLYPNKNLYIFWNDDDNLF